MATFGDGEDSNDDDPTVIEPSPFVSALNEVPGEKTMPRCADCGRVVFFDDFTDAASAISQGLFGDDRCVRSRPDVARWWRWCCERRTAVFYVPR